MKAKLSSSMTFLGRTHCHRYQSYRPVVTVAERTCNTMHETTQRSDDNRRMQAFKSAMKVNRFYNELESILPEVNSDIRANVDNEVRNALNRLHEELITAAIKRRF